MPSLERQYLRDDKAGGFALTRLLLNRKIKYRHIKTSKIKEANETQVKLCDNFQKKVT